MIGKILALLFPGRCPICDEILEYGDMICPECMRETICISEPICKKCGKPIENQRLEYCYDCSKDKHLYDAGRAVFVYQGAVKKSLYRFKYQNKREYAEYYAWQTAKQWGEWIKRQEIDVIVPVPLHVKRKKERGYNQAEIYARKLGKRLGIPVEANLLIRQKNTIPQKELNNLKRKNNLKKAFKCRQNIVQFKRVLLVDDIYTTGSTIDAVAEVLKNKGVKKIFFVCISIGRGW